MLNITAAFSAFQRWTVGLGIEWQLNELRAAVGLPPLQVGGVLLECCCFVPFSAVLPHAGAATCCSCFVPTSPT